MKIFLSLLALLLTFTIAAVNIEGASFDEDVSTVIVDNSQDVETFAFSIQLNNEVKHTKQKKIESLPSTYIDLKYSQPFVDKSEKAIAFRYYGVETTMLKTEMFTNVDTDFQYSQPFVDKNKKAIAYRYYC